MSEKIQTFQQLETLEFDRKNNILKVNGEDFGGTRVDEFKLEFKGGCWNFRFRKEYVYYTSKEETAPENSGAETVE